MHQKRRIRNFEGISKFLLRNSKLSSPYIYPQLLDQIDEDNPNENTSKAGTIIFLVANLRHSFLFLSRAQE